MDVSWPPPKNAVAIYDMISDFLGTEDPFSSIKDRSTKEVLKLYPLLEERIKTHADPLEAAIRLAVCGNVIDYGTSSDFNLLDELDRIFNVDFYKWEYDEFKDRLNRADWVLYIGDNSGESVFDRLLIEELARPVKFVVRGGPIINDVTYKDAIDAGIHKVATIVSSGCRVPGIDFEWCSEEFLKLYHEAPMIISKGQGNFETLSDEKREIFFLFKIKCDVVARHLDCPLGSMFMGRVQSN
ncbi:hypothetical protein DBT_2124 [Dissulfuribacter thermophilus]|uniref:Damage-control phosphatase ARMT1-like metal-binding domain-containing protein n=2 Tax=Dissulfuribacter thermophilus TaxID=1156395 RepID=A0A1B9F3T7_9BACT|nr:hypothetical protein DBT_2124 [Dissulfuribacter thermophilus]